MARHLFISYSRTSADLVDSLEEDIELLGHSVWRDGQLSGGQDWWDRILAEIRDCDALLFVVDRESLASVACQRELAYAGDTGAPILPVLVSTDVTVDMLPEHVQRLQLVNYAARDREAALQLARAIRTLPDRPARPDPLPPPPGLPVSYVSRLRGRVDAEAELSRDEQAALAFELRSALRDPDNAVPARELLERFLARKDLFAVIYRELRALEQSVAPTRDEAAARERDVPPSTLRPSHGGRPARRASSLAVLGYLCGVAGWGILVGSWGPRPLLLSLIPAAAAAATTLLGKDRRFVLVAASVGALVGTYFVFATGSDFGVLVLVGMPLGALAGAGVGTLVHWAQQRAGG